MAWRSAIGQHWGRWSGAVKRELLREPDRVLLDLGPDGAAPDRPKARPAERELEGRRA